MTTIFKKDTYVSPAITSIQIELEHSIASGSVQIAPTNEDFSIQEQWVEEINDENITVNL